MLESPSATDLMAAYFAANQRLFQAGNIDGYILVVRGLIAATFAQQTEAGKDTAVKLSYNLSTNLWPGWDDAPALTRLHLTTGQEAAALNVRIAAVLNLAPERRFNGHWASGALALAVHDFGLAVEHFTAAVELGREAAVETTTTMAESRLAFTAAISGDTSAEADLQQAVSRLEALGDDGLFYASHFEPARSRLATVPA